MMNKHDFLSILVDDGRKYAVAKPGYKDHEIMAIDERVELAGYLLDEDIGKVGLENLLLQIPESTQTLLLTRIATYCMENSLYNASPLVDLIQDIVRIHYEDSGEMQQALTDHRIRLWNQHNKAISNILKQDREDAEREVAL
jgi:hypothetical protein